MGMKKTIRAILLVVAATAGIFFIPCGVSMPIKMNAYWN
jgi:hypothetical protein